MGFVMNDTAEDTVKVRAQIEECKRMLHITKPFKFAQPTAQPWA